jgi:WD40 repeat protein
VGGHPSLGMLRAIAARFPFPPFLENIIMRLIHRLTHSPSRAFLTVLVGMLTLLSAVSVATAATPADALPAFTRWIIAADYSRNGSVLVTAGGESLLYRPGDVVIWQADGSRLADLPGHQTAVWAVDISADGKAVATAGYDGVVKIWDLPGRQHRADLKKQTGWVRSLSFSPDGSRLATAGEDGTVVLWDVAKKTPVATVKAHDGPVTAVAYSPDGTMLVTGGGDRLLKCWKAVDGTATGQCAGHTDTIWAVAFSPAGDRLVSAGADRTVRLWDPATTKPVATLTGHKDWVTSIDCNQDGSRLVSGSLDGAVKLWDLPAAREQEGPKARPASVWCTRFSPDGKSLFIGSHTGGTIVATPAAKLLPLPPSPPQPATPQKQADTAWLPLIPTAFHSHVGATATIAADGTVMVAGATGQDTYTLTAALPAGGTLQRLRLEVLPDPALPAQGPGRAGNGNFVLSELSLKVAAAGGGEPATPVKLVGVTADYSQGGWNIAGAIDGNLETGWGVAGGTGDRHAAVFEVAKEPAVPGGATVSIVVDQQYADGVHSLGKFRLSVEQASAQSPTAEQAKADDGAKKAVSAEQKPAKGVQQ